MPTDASEVVRAISVLRGVPQEELLQLPTERLEFQPGAVLFAQGTPSDCVYGVLTGRLKIVKRAGPTREFCLEVLGPGEPVAAVAVIRKVPMPAAAVALERTAALKIPADAFRDLMVRHPLVSARMLDMISKRLLEAGNSRLELATQPVEVRLARALLRLGEKFGERRTNEWIFSQNITRQNLADLAGTTVESAIRVMSAWTKTGSSDRVTAESRSPTSRRSSGSPPTRTKRTALRVAEPRPSRTRMRKVCAPRVDPDQGGGRSGCFSFRRPMELELATIQKLRRDHRELLERFADTLHRFRRSALPPAGPTSLALCRLVDFLQTKVPAHFRKEACLSCPSFRECSAGRAKPEASECGDVVASGRDEHAELAELIGQLAGTATDAAATGDAGLWQQSIAQTAELEHRFAMHIAGEEQAFKQRVLDSGISRPPVPGRRRAPHS